MINRPLGAHAPGGRSFYTPLALTVTIRLSLLLSKPQGASHKNYRIVLSAVRSCAIPPVATQATTEEEE